MITKTKGFIEIEDTTTKGDDCEIKITDLISRQKMYVKMSPENLIDLKQFLERKIIQLAISNIM